MYAPSAILKGEISFEISTILASGISLYITPLTDPIK
jgi:hypothetical protein